MQDATYVEDAMALSDSLICLTFNEADKQSCPVETAISIHDFGAWNSFQGNYFFTANPFSRKCMNNLTHLTVT